jgi:uncharacterized protein (DUF1778 family)
MGAGFLDIETMVRELQSEIRSERLEQRIKPTMKQMIELAAMLTGTDTSEFVTMAALQAAIERIREMRRVQLTAEQAARFFDTVRFGGTPRQLEIGLDSEHMAKRARCGFERPETWVTHLGCTRG